MRFTTLVAGGILLAQSLGPLREARADDAPPKPPAIASANGVRVVFLSNSATTIVYLARGDMPSHSYPDPFERIGLAPVSVRLAPGTYTVETGGPTQSDGHQRFVVEHDAPLNVTIHPGDPSLKLVGGVLVALGVVSVALGIVAIVSFSKDDGEYNRWAIGLPLTIGGAVGSGLGVALSAAGSTDIQVPHLPPGGLARPAAFVPTLTLSF